MQKACPPVVEISSLSGRRQSVHELLDIGGVATLRSDALRTIAKGVDNKGLICWMIALCQSLAASSWMLKLLSNVRLTTDKNIGPGNALCEGIQRCCNNRGVFPVGKLSKFPESQRHMQTLARVVLPLRPRDDDLTQDSCEGLMKAVQQVDSPLAPLFSSLLCDDVTWFIRPHAESCRDSKDRLLYRAPGVPSSSRGMQHSPLFLVTSEHLDIALTIEPTIDVGSYFSSYFSDNLGSVVSSNRRSLAHYLNVSLRGSDKTDTCCYCGENFSVTTRRKLKSLPAVLVVSLQRSADFSIPGQLYLNNWGGDEQSNAAGSYRLVAVMTYYSRPSRHYTANVRCETPTGAVEWLLCDDARVKLCDGPGTSFTNDAHSACFAAGLVFDRMEV